MRRLLLAGVALTLLWAVPASAQTITRDGSDYNGIANPGDPPCRILVHDHSPAELHVNCRWASEPARIRYRYLRDRGGRFEPADVLADWERHGGRCATVETTWRVEIPRTLRVVVPVGCYLHIVEVHWQQPANGD